MKENQLWVLCPICNNKTRIKIRKDTQLIHFPLFCPKCKNESLVTVSYTHLDVYKRQVYNNEWNYQHDYMAFQIIYTSDDEN